MRRGQTLPQKQMKSLPYTQMRCGQMRFGQMRYGLTPGITIFPPQPSRSPPMRARTDFQCSCGRLQRYQTGTSLIQTTLTCPGAVCPKIAASGPLSQTGFTRGWGKRILAHVQGVGQTYRLRTGHDRRHFRFCSQRRMTAIVEWPPCGDTPMALNAQVMDCSGCRRHAMGGHSG